MHDSTMAVGYCVHDDHWYLKQSLSSFASAGELFVFVSKVPWYGAAGNWEKCAEVAHAAGANVIVGEWSDEAEHRRYCVSQLKGTGRQFALIPDGDEIADRNLISILLRLAIIDAADIVRVHMDTYWRSPDYLIQPRERLTPILLINLQRSDHLHIREYSGERVLVLGPEYGLLHHLSYAGPDERIARKISTWGHREEVQGDWLEQVWLSWPSDRLMTNLHPTHPPAYGRAQRVPRPEILREVPDYSGLDNSHWPEPIVPPNWPAVSIIIPVHGAFEELAKCLATLRVCGKYIAEVILVDDASPGDLRGALGELLDGCTLLENDRNLGFAATCNRGASAAKGDVLVFLNSDTIVPQWGLLRLIESILHQGAAAAGPCSNNAGYHQKVPAVYDSLESLNGMAEDFAHRPNADREVDMLVGFCLAVARPAWEEVGGFDERFYPGMFEDNDLCYRLRRAGYRLVVSERSFVHHEGSKSITQGTEHITKMLDRNRKVYESKWAADLESGFASHLAGHSPDPIRFDEARRPEKITAEIRSEVDRANISLCMIVKNEERVLRACLESARPFFTQMVVVDTGSSDRTAEIARECGAEVYEFPWTDSFAEARNESLRHAHGKWCFWMDADDTLPFGSGIEIIKCAIEAPEGIVAYVVPVQFTDAGSGTGTRVDHVKLFRNVPGVRFEGRIHEQNMGSLREIGGEIARSNAVVLHTNYDTSPEGQARKRERDYHLLKLDLAERPTHPFVLFNLGMTDHFTGQHESAIKWLRQSIQNAKNEESHVRKAFALLGGSLKALDKREEALAELEEGIRRVGPDPELHFLAGTLLTDLQKYSAAREQYEAMPLDVSGHFSSIDPGILTYKRSHNLGVVYQAERDYPSARKHLLDALSHRPIFTPSAVELFRCAMEVRDLDTASQVLDLLFDSAGPSETWSDLGSQFALQTNAPGGSVGFLERAINAHPLAVGPRLVYARLLLNGGRERDALPHLHALVEQGCGEASFYLGVFATRAGELDHAIHWMEMAHRLDPEHEETRRSLDSLRRAVASEEPAISS